MTIDNFDDCCEQEKQNKTKVGVLCFSLRDEKKQNKRLVNEDVFLMITGTFLFSLFFGRPSVGLIFVGRVDGQITLATLFFFVDLFSQSTVLSAYEKKKS